MMRILFVLFVLLPLLELYVLIEVGSGIGGLLTIGLCLLTAAAGGLIIRLQGVKTLLHARESIQNAQQQQLAEHGMHGILLAVAGLLLFIPGFITDALGFLLLIPAFRKFLMFKNSVSYSYKNTQEKQAPSRYKHVIDAEIVKKD